MINLGIRLQKYKLCNVNGSGIIEQAMIRNLLTAIQPAHAHFVFV